MTYTIWQDRTDKKSAAERGIAREIFRNLLGAGYAVSVWNGEDYAQAPTLNRDKLLAALAQTDGDDIEVYEFDKKTKRLIKIVGYVTLIWGNDPFELIADYSTNLEEILAPALAKAEATEARF